MTVGGRDPAEVIRISQRTHMPGTNSRSSHRWHGVITRILPGDRGRGLSLVRPPVAGTAPENAVRCAWEMSRRQGRSQPKPLPAPVGWHWYRSVRCRGGRLHRFAENRCGPLWVNALALVRPSLSAAARGKSSWMNPPGITPPADIQLRQSWTRLCTIEGFRFPAVSPIASRPSLPDMRQTLPSPSPS